MVTTLRIWMAKHCLECSRPKPKFTAICDDCARWFGQDYGLRFYMRKRKNV